MPLNRAPLLILISNVYVSFQTVDIAEGHCGKPGYVGQSDWFSCFKKVKNDCPHGFIKIKKPTAINTNYCDGSDEKVCCLIVPRIQIEVKTIVMLRTDN